MDYGLNPDINTEIEKLNVPQEVKSVLKQIMWFEYLNQDSYGKSKEQYMKLLDELYSAGLERF